MAAPRIAILTTFYPPYNFGGDGIGVQRMARAFAGRGWEVTVVHEVDAYLTLAGGEPQAEAADDGVKVVGLRSRLGAVSNLMTHQLGRPVMHHRSLSEILSPGAFDVVWFNNVSLLGGPGLLSYGDGLKIYEAHEHWLVCPTHVLWRYDRELCDGRECLRCVLSYRRPPQLWRYTGLLARQLRHVDAFIAKSEFSRDKHREFGFPRAMEVIPGFLPDREPEPEGAAHSPSERPYFLFVGRLEKLKGLQDVLPAFAGEGGSDLLVAGSGGFEGALRAMAAGMPRVKFVGRLNSAELVRYYRHATALIVPSLCYETFGVIIIEAFQNGAPVVARALGPFPELVSKSGGGLLFDDAEGLKAALERLETDQPLREQLATAARLAFQANWSEGAVMSAYEELLARLAAAKGDTRLLDVLAASGET